MANKNNIKILMIEDDLDQVMMYRTQFELDGFAVFNAKKYDEVMKIIEQEKPNIILLDLILGAVSGEEVLKKLAKARITDTIPVIIFSNLGSIKDEEKFVKLGARKYWPKTKYVPRQVGENIIKFLQGTM